MRTEIRTYCHNPFESFSRYRTELMGIAIIGVLIAHFVGLLNANNLILSVLYRTIPRIAFTQGFLILSGFGLYYSFAKNDNVKLFYQRRFFRLFIPFVILSGWYYISKDFIIDFNPENFLLHITTAGFWVMGNYDGMWYVAVSIVLYLFFPLLFKSISRGKWMSTLLLVITFLALNFGVQSAFPFYYDKIGIGLAQIPAFILGIYIGQLSYQKKQKQSIALLLILLVSWIVSFCLRDLYDLAKVILGFEEKVIYMLFLCFLLDITSNNRITVALKHLLQWCGSYSLELYVLHLLIYYFIDTRVMGEFSQLTKVSLMVICALILCVPFQKITKKISGKLRL